MIKVDWDVKFSVTQLLNIYFGKIRASKKSMEAGLRWEEEFREKLLKHNISHEYQRPLNKIYEIEGIRIMISGKVDFIVYNNFIFNGWSIEAPAILELKRVSKFAKGLDERYRVQVLFYYDMLGYETFNVYLVKKVYTSDSETIVVSPVDVLNYKQKIQNILVYAVKNSLIKYFI